MERTIEIIPVFMDEGLPPWEEVKESHLYISEMYGGSCHLCFCGCGMQIYIPLSVEGKGGDWKLIKLGDGKVTVDPSLEHWNGCQSHYSIIENKVIFSE